MGSMATKERWASVRPGFVIVFAAVFVMFILVYALRATRGPVTGSREVALRILALRESYDAAGLMRYVSKQEREAGLDERDLQEILDRVYRPPFEGFERKEVVFEDPEEPNPAFYMMGVRYEHPDGRSVVVSPLLDAGDSGPVQPAMAFWILFDALKAQSPADPNLREAVLSRYELDYLGLRNLRPVLHSLRAKGVYMELRGF